MSTVDNKVVELRFDNNGFAQGIKATLNGLAELNKTLSKQVATTAIDGLTKSVSTATEHFSALRVTAIGALLEVGKKVTDTAVNFAKSFTTAPIEEGFKNYETKINAIQTILANTGLEGSKGLEQVTGVLKDLNVYANQTIFNFADMTKNIGTFTAAGVALKPASEAIKGIANLSALSGSSAEQASGAMYQLSQAIAANKVQAQDWNSVVNAGIGGKVFQEQLFNTGVALKRIKGVKVGESFAQWTKAGNTFKGSLKDGWIDAKVLTQTLSHFTGGLTAAQLKSQGYNAEQIKQIIKIGNVSEESATKIKTVSQLAQALKEEVGTAYATIFETLIGNIDQAKSLLSPLHTFIENGLTNPIYKLNTILQNWANIGGRIIFLDAIKQAFNDIMRAISPVRKAFEHIFPSGDAVVKLFNFTIQIDNFFKLLKMGPHMADNVRRTFQGFFAVLDIGRQVLSGVGHFLKDMFGALTKGEGSGGFLLITAHIGDFLVHLDKTIKKGHAIQDFFKKLEDFVQPAIDKFHEITAALAGLFDSGKGISTRGLQDQFKIIPSIADKIHDAFIRIPEVFHSVVKGIQNFLDAIKPFAGQVASALGTAGHKIADFFGNIDYEHLAKILERIGSVIGTVFTNLPGIIEKVYGAIKNIVHFITDVLSGIPTVISQVFGNIDYSQLLATINTGLFAGLLLILRKFLNKSKGISKEAGPGLFKSISGSFGALTETLEQMQKNLKAAVLIEIAIAIGILAASCLVLSKINPLALGKAIAAIGAMMAQLFIAMDVFGKYGGASKLAAVSASLIIFGGAILVLTASVKILSGIDWKGLTKGLLGVGILLGELTLATKFMDKDSAGMISAGTGLTIMAVGIRILVKAVEELGKQDYDTLKKGLVSVGLILAELALFTQLSDVDGAGIISGAGLVLLAVGINQLSKSVEKFGKMDTGVIKKGLATMGLILAGIAAFSFVGSEGLIGASLGLIAISFAMNQLIKPIKAFAAMSWSEIGKGLTVLAGSLTAIGVALSLIPPTSLLSAGAIAAVAASMLLIADAMKSFSGMSWEEIAKGMVTLAGSLTIMGAAMDIMTAGLPGAAAILVMSAALSILAPVLVTLGNLSWVEIAKGLVALAGAFAVLGLAGVLLTPLVPTLIGLGIAVGLIGIGVAAIGLGVLAFSAGLTALSLAGTGAAAAIIAISSAVVSLLPLMTASLVKAFDVLIVALTKAVPDLLKFVEKTLLSLIQLIVKVTPPLVKALVTMAKAMLDAFSAHAGEFATKMTKGLLGILTAIDKNSQQLSDKGVEIIVNVIKGVNKQMPALVDAATDLVVKFLKGIAYNVKKMIAAGTQIIINVIKGIGASALQITNAALDTIVIFLNGLSDAIDSHSDELTAAGERVVGSILDGLTFGLAKKAQSVFNKFESFGSTALSWLAKGAGVASPSKKAIAIAKFVADGFVIGLRNGAPGVKAAFDEVSTQFKQMISDSADDIKNYQDKIAAANPKTKAGAAAIVKYTAALNDANKAHKEGIAALDVLSTHFTKEHAHLLALGKEWDGYAASLDKANQKLADAKSLRDNFTSGVVGQFGGQAGIDANTDTGTFLDTSAEKLADLKKFESVLKALRKAGIDDATYQQLLSVGTDALPFMEDLLKSGKPAIDQINTIDKSIQKEAANLAANSYKALYQTQGQKMYNLGVASAEGLVKGLKSKEAAIAKQMSDIGADIIKALKKALGIKSPSKAMAILGQFMGQGIVVGLDSSSKDIQKSAANLGVVATTSLKDSISGLVNNVVDKTNLSPTITPVLDLSSVKKTASDLPGMLATGPVLVNDAYMRALSASSTYQASVAAARSQAEPTPATPAPNQYTQNVYSPKAVSTAELYRQTKNLVSIAKGA